ncbi:MAG: hypothetical protein JKY54_03295 [Flavobacteriales bacterium]|nr:hypothetical protein [Flavobacteriales bacterium]
MQKLRLFFVAVAALIIFQNCTIIQPRQVGVDIKLGKTKDKLLLPGPHHFAPKFTRYVVKYTTRTINYSKELHFHSSEGISVESDITILYHLNADSVIGIHTNYGPGYQSKLIDDYLITSLRKIGLSYEAQDLVNVRTEFEEKLKSELVANLEPKGIVIEFVMFKDFHLPSRIMSTIQARLNAEEMAKKAVADNKVAREQLAFYVERGLKEKELEISKQRLDLEFAIEKQKMEAQRLIIEATAIKEQQELINSTLSDQLIKMRSIEITSELVKSGNAKIIITDGRSPVVLHDTGLGY